MRAMHLALLAILIGCAEDVDPVVESGGVRSDGSRDDDVCGGAAGACLLEYNSALVPDGEDPCCYREGSANECDPEVACNELSGPECCVLYATEASGIGEACCRYGHGATPYDGDGNDITEACGRLITAP